MSRCVPRPATLALLALVACGGDRAPSMVLEEVVADPLEGDPDWRVLEAVPGGAPGVDVLTPAVDTVHESADRLCLVVPPPGAVEVVVPADGWMEPSVGVSHALARALLRQHGRRAQVAIDFEIALNGEPRGAARVVTRARADAGDFLTRSEPHVWHALGEEGGFEVSAGDRLTLRTKPAGAVPEGLGPLPAGFAGLEVVRRFQVRRTRASRERPNVVLVVVDTERRDRTSTYGYARETTPNLDRLAARGLTYEWAYATSSWTWPSAASILTGRLPAAHGVVDDGSSWLEDELVTLAEVLQAEGFTTAAFSANALVSPERNFDQGFEHFLVEKAGGPEGTFAGDAIVPPALEWLERNREHRFFLYVHLMDPHTPHLPRPGDLERFCGVTEAALHPRAFDARSQELRSAKVHTPDGRPLPFEILTRQEARWYSDVYDACVATGDYWVGVLLDTIEAFGLNETTVIAYTSDHGEELLDHDNLSHAHALWQELVTVPLVLAGPGIPAGERAALPVSNRHLAPTLARIGGARLEPPGTWFDLARPAALEPHPVFLETRQGWWKGRGQVGGRKLEILGVVDDGWVLHWCPLGRPWDAPDGADPGEGEVLLFDLAKDPLERDDRSAAEPERVRRMKELVLREREVRTRELPARKRRAGAATAKLLEQLGYAFGGDGDQEQ